MIKLGKSAVLVAGVLAAVILGAGAGAGAAGPEAVDPPRAKPDAPGPQFVAATDLSRLGLVRDAIGKRDYERARTLAAQMEDPAAKSLAQWYYFDAEDPLVSIEASDAFLDAHPEWPSQTKIQSNAEKRMPWTLAPSTILAFFQSRDPITGEGKIQLARAQFMTGAPDAGLHHLKDAWINDNFTLPDEQRIMSVYGGRLTAEDHARRADRLLWAREVATAKRLFPRLPSDVRRRDEARAALLLGGADGARHYEALPADDRADPGVMLAAVRYFRRMEEEPRAIAIARNAPVDAATLRDAGAWWYEQNLLMRWALKNRQYADAYLMAAHHGLLPEDAAFSEAEFSAGWIALRYLNEPARAEKHFAALTASVGAPISLSRGWYWLGRAAEARGDKDAAFARYSKAAEQIYTFYGQLAAEKAGGAALARKFESGPPATAEEKARFGSRPAVAALRMLTDIRDDRAFLIFAYYIDDQLQSRGEFRELADLAMRMNAPHIAVRAGKVAVRTGANAADISYPEIFVPSAATRFAPAEVILGLSRQESEFNPRAYSRAGARGVMQLIPSTAQATARKEGIKYNRAALLDDPHYNMTIGSAHLSHLIDRFGGSWIMTFAGYNAGVNRVSQWVEAYGDPRDPSIDPLDWIEQIPFEETRNYVQRVLENSQIYRSRLSNVALAGALSRDIERGGAANRVGARPALSAAGPLPDVQPRIIAVGDKILSPLAEADTAAALSHVRVKPPLPDKKKSAVKGSRTTKAQTSSRRTRGARSKTPLDDKAVRHDAAPAPESAGAIAGEPDPQKPATQESGPPPAISPIAASDGDRAIEAKVENEAAYAEEGLIAPEDAAGLAASGAAASEAETANIAGACVTYSDFIAETAKEEASADDLNAGALVELIGAGKPCSPEMTAPGGAATTRSPETEPAPAVPAPPTDENSQQP